MRVLCILMAVFHHMRASLILNTKNIMPCCLSQVNITAAVVQHTVIWSKHNAISRIVI